MLSSMLSTWLPHSRHSLSQSLGGDCLPSIICLSFRSNTFFSNAVTSAFTFAAHPKFQISLRTIDTAARRGKNFVHSPLFFSDACTRSTRAAFNYTNAAHFCRHFPLKQLVSCASDSCPIFLHTGFGISIVGSSNIALAIREDSSLVANHSSAISFRSRNVSFSTPREMAKPVPTTTIPVADRHVVGQSPPSNFDFDLAVVGGGSGGLACAKMAAAHAVKVVVFDFVKPSTQGSKWGLGGTCVNVGCVPKLLFHHAALLAPALQWDAPHVGWKGQFPQQVDWQSCVQAVQSYVRSLNFGYRTGLRTAGVKYINALAEFSSPNELVYTEKGQKKRCTARYIVVAVGGRPHVPADVIGAKELSITSDDIFSLQHPPGKTLCVGASYISLECAGFLEELGFDVTVAVRSVLLRGFDRQCAEFVGQTLAETGVKILRGYVPVKLEKQCNGKIRVTFLVHEQQPEKTQQKDRQEKTISEEFDTVLYATGRYADTSGLNLAAAGVNVSSSGKIICDNDACTSSPSVFAIGDTVEKFPELTPVAIKAGEVLARRLFANSSEKMDFENIPTTVFTPFEYAHTGLSEEAATAKYGAEALEIYLFQFTPLFLSAMHRQKAVATRNSEEDTDLTPPCLAKLICLKQEDERVVGIHFIGPHAGEVMQGFALALRLGAKKSDFDKCVGIHPTNAEAFMALTITKSSGESFVATGGCGGGKCG